MGKRSSFERLERDRYLTPPAAVPFLVRHLRPGFRFVEPCAADHGLANCLIAAGGACLGCYDIEPQHPAVVQRDALTLTRKDVSAGAMFITNLPFTRALMHELIGHLVTLAPLWTFLDLDWFATAQAAPFADRLHAVQCLPRFKFFAGTRHTGKDNHVWALFKAEKARRGARLYLQRQNSVSKCVENARSVPLPFPQQIG